MVAHSPSYAPGLQTGSSQGPDNSRASASRNRPKCKYFAQETPRPDPPPQSADRSAQSRLCPSRGDEFLSGADHVHDHAVARDRAVRLGSLVRLRVELNPEEGEPPAHAGANERRVLADARRKNERIETAERRRH